MKSVGFLKFPPLFSGLAIACALFTASCVGGGQGSGQTDGGGWKYAELIPESEADATTRAQAAPADGMIAVDATVYRGLMEMLGEGHRCADFSTEMKPDAERVALARPSMFLLSAYEGQDATKYERLGIKVVPCRDFLERSPLRRAEWMRFLGRLWGVGERADSLFQVVEREYESIRKPNSTAQAPTAFFDLLYGNIWYQPSGMSSMAQLVSDAGGAVPFSSDGSATTLALSAEQVLIAAREADVWIIRYAAPATLTLHDLSALNPVYAQFRAFQTGNVYACNTLETKYYDEVPFRPDWLLKDLQAIFSAVVQSAEQPEPSKAPALRYFKKLR